MKKCLALIAVLVATVCHAEGSPEGGLAANVRQISVQKSVPAQSFTQRQLSAQERAELRRQLSQYSRSGAKGP